MKDRREFLKGAATGAMLLGAHSRLGLAEALAQRAAATKSRVVVARDAGLRITGSQPDQKRVQALLDKAMASYTGREKPLEAWKRVIPPAVLKSGVIGIKVNGLGGRGISTHAELVIAICERLREAGVAPGNIVVWDRNARDLMACGMTINTDRNRVRCFGSDISGFEDQQESYGTAKIKLSKILTRECAMVISVPILKDHDLAGMTFSMKNMYGVVDRPDHLHGNNCNPGVADLNCIAAIRQKVTLTIGDAMKSVYQGGPVYRPERICYPNALVVGEDRVAVDRVALKILNSHRVQQGLQTLEAAGRAPDYIATAADAAHRLGVNDPQRIQMLEV